MFQDKILRPVWFVIAGRGEPGNVIAPAAHALLVFRIVTEPSLLLPLLDGVIADSILSYEIITSNSPQV